MMRKISLSVLLPLLAIALFACRKNAERPSWEVDVLAPVATTSLTINDLIADSFLNVNPDSSLTLVYDNTVYRYAVSELVDIPDTTFSESFTLPFGSAKFGPGDTIYPSPPGVTEFNAQGAQLTDLIIRSGTIEFTLTSTISQPHEVVYTIRNSGFGGPGGAPFTTTVPMPAGSQSNPAMVVDTRDLSGYYIDLRGPNGNEFNQMETEFIVINSLGSDSVQISAGDNASVDSRFIDILPQYVKGYFGSEVASINPDVTAVSAFERIIDGTLDIDDVDVTLELVNGVGVDARSVINNLTAINNRTGNTVALNHPVIGSSVNLNRAQDNGGSVSPSTFSVNLNPSNSNIDVFLENLPDQLGYDLGLTINPLGNVSNGNDFLYYESALEVNLNATLPLCLLANDLTLSDTLELDLQEDSIQGRINSGTLHVVAENGFPLQFDLQLYLLDQNNQPTDSFVSMGSIAAGVINASQVVEASTPSQVEITLSEEQMNALYEGNRRMELRAVFNTPTANPPHYKLYDHYKLDLTVTIDLNYTVELE